MFRRLSFVRCAQHRTLTPQLAILSVIFMALGLFAQATGRIGGTVIDPSGQVAPGVTVVCRNTETGLTRSADTNQSGIFEFPDLPIRSEERRVGKESRFRCVA